MEYTEDDLLALSGIQHFAFCRRQWALTAVERQWQDNWRTVQGTQLHERVDNPDLFEARGDILTARAMPLSSYQLGLYGVADMVEFHADKNGTVLRGRAGTWLPMPVEYKRGQPKRDDCDELQLCAQALCLEEMLCTSISEGRIYYGETRHRIAVVFTETLRERVRETAQQMHDLFNRKYTPPPKRKDKRCRSCSLMDVCLPKLGAKQTVARYVNGYLKAAEAE